MRLAPENHLNRISQYTAEICHSWKCCVSGYDFGNWLNNNNNNKKCWHLARKVSFIPRAHECFGLRNAVGSEKGDATWHSPGSLEMTHREQSKHPAERGAYAYISHLQWYNLGFSCLWTGDKNRLLCPTLGRNYWEKIDLVSWGDWV